MHIIVSGEAQVDLLSELERRGFRCQRERRDVLAVEPAAERDGAVLGFEELALCLRLWIQLHPDARVSVTD